MRGDQCGAVPQRATLTAEPYTFGVRCVRDPHPATDSHLSDWVYPTPSATVMPPAPPRAMRLEWWD